MDEVPLKQLARHSLLPRGTPYSRVWEWLRSGCLTPDGRRVRLAGRRVGGRWFSRPEDLLKFLNELNGEVMTGTEPVLS